MTSSDNVQPVELPAGLDHDAVPTVGPFSAEACAAGTHGPVRHTVVPSPDGRWEGDSCWTCNSWITTPRLVTEAEQTERMQLGLLTNDDGSWSLQDKYGNVAAVGPALSRQLVMDILTRAMGAGQEVTVAPGADCPPECSEGHTYGPGCAQRLQDGRAAGPQLVVPGQGGLDTLPAEHLVVPGHVRKDTSP